MTTLPVMYEAVIGIEVHCQLATDSKIFCACRARTADGTSVADIEPNADTCPVCAGHPGTLPVINRKVVEYAIQAGLATGCEIRRENIFARKNYFYPDLPKGYQISQYDRPICEGGALDIEVPQKTSEGDGTYSKRVAIQRIHMEEDAGKNVHGLGYSVVNLNRAGVPLIEIVTGPDLSSPAEAGAYLRALHAVVTYLGICDGNMQEGNFRCDANVSVRPVGQAKLGTRCEIKNVNSFRFVEKAIDFEINRQIALVQSGGWVVQETRGYDSARNATYTMRSKEEAQDYRYFPDPDLVPIRIAQATIDALRAGLPELPAQRRARYVATLGLTAYDAAAVTGSRDLAIFFEGALAAAGTPGADGAAAAQATAKTIANLLTGELTRLLGESDLELSASKLTPAHVAELARLVVGKVVSSTGAKRALAVALETGDAVAAIVEREGLQQVSDASTLGPAISKVLDASPAQVADILAGKDKVIGYLVGQVMKATGGKANPALVQDLIRAEINQRKKP